MRCSQVLSALTLVLLVHLVVFPATAVTIHIPADLPTITEGLSIAVSGDTLLIAPGLYLEHDLTIPSGVSLLGATGDPDDVVIDAQQQGRVVVCIDLAELVRIEALTLTGGLATLETVDSTMGGGLFINAAPAEVRHCRFVDNEAEIEGGGITCDNGADAWIVDCVVMGNRSVDGAGISCRASSPLLENCIIAGNDGLVWGGALFCRSGSNPRVLGCTLVGNDAHFGAGIWALDGPNIQVENSIIAFGITGEGIFAYDNEGYPSEIHLVCCNVFGNAGGGYGGTSQDQTGIDGNIAEDPLFCDPENFDFTVAGASPCLPQNNDCSVQMGVMGLGCDPYSGADDNGGPPSATRLMQNHPNPFNPRTEISFDLDRDSSVTLVVYDSRGRLIRTLIPGEQRSAGAQRISWDGCDDDGRQLPSGIYLYRLTTVEGNETRKMTLAR